MDKKKLSEAARMLGSVSTPKKTLAARRNIRKRWEQNKLKKDLTNDSNAGIIRVDS